MFDALLQRGFQIDFHGHAKAILGADFPEAITELESALVDIQIPITEIIAGGGGEALGTQRLRHALTRIGWRKTTFVVEKRINNVPRESQSHEVDHVREFSNGSRIALEIEWNNKDPFFDRDLENFKRLHSDGAISIGIIVTRGRSLHENMKLLVRRFLDMHAINELEALSSLGYEPTRRQRQSIAQRARGAEGVESFRSAFTNTFVSDKFGEATTHWRKLEDRVRRGVGNPCPLVLIGLPDGVVSFSDKT